MQPTAADARVCADLTRKHARTFAFASTFLPARKQRGAFALYTFCRRADDLADRVSADRTPHGAQQELAQYHARLAATLAGRAGDEAFRELAWTVAEFSVPRSLLEDLLNGIGRDLTPTVYHTWEDLRGYAEGVASSVGEMLVYVFGTARTHDVPAALHFARTLGVAMQLTNILRDVGEDARNGRCYLPDDELARFGLSRDAVLDSRVDPHAAPWQRFVKFQIARARELYREGARGIALLAPDARRCTWICAAGYGAILAAIERNAYDTFSMRARVSRWEQARIVLGTWVSPESVVIPQPTRHPAVG
ncbi:MAG: phytoene/squalene synthase family protein [Gemmatimonadaceae bacterium]